MCAPVAATVAWSFTATAAAAAAGVELMRINADERSLLVRVARAPDSIARRPGAARREPQPSSAHGGARSAGNEGLRGGGVQRRPGDQVDQRAFCTARTAGMRLSTRPGSPTKAGRHGMLTGRRPSPRSGHQRGPPLMDNSARLQEEPSSLYCTRRSTNSPPLSPTLTRRSLSRNGVSK